MCLICNIRFIQLIVDFRVFDRRDCSRSNNECTDKMHLPRSVNFFY